MPALSHFFAVLRHCLSNRIIKMFARLLTVVVALSISFVAALPSKRAMARFDSNVQIHESCRANKTRQDMLERAFVDVKNLTATAKRCMCSSISTYPPQS
jgi:hypothetical protein